MRSPFIVKRISRKHEFIVFSSHAKFTACVFASSKNMLSFHDNEKYVIVTPTGKILNPLQQREYLSFSQVIQKNVLLRNSKNG